MSESLTKTKLTDPLILDLLQNIREHRSKLEDLEGIKIDPNLTNIVSNEIGRELYIQNEFHKAKGFRKLHIEVAEFSKNLKILHCVFFPDPKFDIPIFGMDLVKINDIVSAAIVDLSPASQNQGMKYEKLLSEVDKSSFPISLDIMLVSFGSIFILSRSSSMDLCSLIFCNKSKIRGSVNFVLVKDSDNKAKKYQNRI